MKWVKPYLKPIHYVQVQTLEHESLGVTYYRWHCSCGIKGATWHQKESTCHHYAKEHLSGLDK